jgi:hypothetical protein
VPTSYAEQEEEEEEEGPILTNTAWYLWGQGNHQDAQDIIVKALALRQSALGPNNKHNLVSKVRVSCTVESLFHNLQQETCSIASCLFQKW